MTMIENIYLTQSIREWLDNKKGNMLLLTILLIHKSWKKVRKWWKKSPKEPP